METVPIRKPFGAVSAIFVPIELSITMANQIISILGGTGFVGHHLAVRLSNAGYRCRILTRRPERHRDLSVVPGVELRRANPFDRTQLGDQFAGCSAVINLVGILNESARQSFEHLHVELVERIGEAAREADVERFLHMSALHADPETGSSRYLRTKGEGEKRAHAQVGLHVTSFRPSVIFGVGDSFFNRFAALLRMVPGPFPLACPDARFAPVYVGDVTDAMAATLEDHNAWGKAFDLCGPRVFTLRELVEYTARTIGRKPLIIGLNAFASRLQGRVFQHLPGKPFTMDNYLSMQTPSTCEHNGLLDLGVRPTDVEAVVPHYLSGAYAASSAGAS
jgi:uncharacterized protein YbjT (DUF2867 family)